MPSCSYLGTFMKSYRAFFIIVMLKSSEVTWSASKDGPRPVLSTVDAVSLIVGIVVGAGIFSFPSLVASNTSSSTAFILVWLLGGIISLIGALCYAELASAFPSAGGDYHFLRRAFGPKLAFLFAWARITVIQTGSVAILAFIFGDYVTQLYNVGPLSPVIYAALIIAVLTLINILGVQFGAGVQKVLTTLEIIGVATIIIAGLFFAPATVDGTPAASGSGVTSLGLAMVFVLLTFGGWNEAAYLSSEMRRGKRQIAVALMLGIATITVLYVLINLAYINVLGLEGVAASNAVAADVMRLTFGEGAAWAIGLMVAIAALTSANATIFTGARTSYALGRDFRTFGILGRWNGRVHSPINAFIVQGAIALALVGLSILAREGIKSIIDYTAPVFWFFFLMVGLSLFVLRRKEPNTERPFRVPLYPITPAIFCLTSLYLLYSSLTYTGWGSLVGVGVLGLGALILAVLPALDNLIKKDDIRREEDEISPA